MIVYELTICSEYGGSKDKRIVLAGDFAEAITKANNFLATTMLIDSPRIESVIELHVIDEE